LHKDTYSLTRYPLSLGYLAGSVRKDTDWAVVVYNADFVAHNETKSIAYLTTTGFDNYVGNLRNPTAPVWREIRSTIEDYQPRVVGISVKSQNFASACLVAKLAKEVNENITVVVGGPHASMVGKEVLDYPAIDVAVRNEGEETLVDLLNAIDTGRNLGDVRGISYRADGQAVDNPARPFIQDLDALPFPNEVAPYVLKDYDKYPPSALSRIFALRGCPYDCMFCGSRNVWSRKVRYRSPQNVIREIKGLQRLGVKRVHFDDDTFGVDRRWIKELCEGLIKECPGLLWNSEMTVNLVNDETIGIMRAAGCEGIQIGIESGNNEMLKLVRKKMTIEQGLEAAKIIKRHGIRLEVFFIVGFPQETEESLNDTVKAMKKIKADVINYSIFTPYPGTESFETCKKLGLIDANFDVAVFNHQSPANCFCVNITPERFRMLASKIEVTIDRKNWLNRVRRGFSMRTLKRIPKFGIASSVRKGFKTMREGGQMLRWGTY
jgi:anaerobic magnesium-protoporphyrin IX monomethyl ester cyclase